MRDGVNPLLASCLSALDPTPTSTLLKTPGAVPVASAAVPPRKARPSIKALQPEVPPPFTPIPGIPATTSTGNKSVSGATSVADKSADEDDVVRVPGIIPPNVLPLQSESSFGTVPRYSTAIQQLLEARGTRTTARLGFKGLGDAGAAELANILGSGTCQMLEGLDVSCNEMGPLGASALAAALQRNHVLRMLDISTNAIGDLGATGIAEALKSNARLTYLDVHACGIRDSGATALAGALEENCTLAVLNLKANYLSDQAAVALAKVARKSKSLRALITTSNDIEQVGEKALADAMNDNDKLVDFMPVEVLASFR